MISRSLCRLAFRRKLCTSAQLSLVDSRNDPEFPKECLILEPNFINTHESTVLEADIERMIKRYRLQYSNQHFDRVISGYRELSASDDKWSAESQLVLQRMRKLARERLESLEHGSTELVWKSPHILDLSETGVIGAHVDNSSYSGRIVSALCLHSTAVVRFRNTSDTNRFADVLLRPGTFYGHLGKLRYEYSHEIAASDDGNYYFDNIVSPRKRRISLMVRSSN